MNKYALLILPVFLSFTSANSFAAGYPLPVGHEESFMGNTGAALEDSPGNVIYNPAGLAFRNSKDLNLTVSGNALGQQRFETGLQDETSDVTIRPLLAAGVYPAGDGYASIFIANPISIKIIQGQDQTILTTNTRTTLNVQFDVITGGVAYAGLIDKDLSWGLSGGIYYATQEVHSYVSAVQSGVSAQTAYQEDRLRTIKLILTPGVMWKATDFWILGLTGQLFPWNISSSASQLKSQTNSATPNQVTQTSSKYDPSPSANFNLTFGQQFIFAKNHLLLDVNYAAKSSQKDVNGVEAKYPESWSYNLGWKLDLSQKWKPLAGFSFSDLNNSENYLFTGGVSLAQRRNELLLGAYYQKDNSKAANSSSSESIGIMFSSNVAY